MNTANYKLMKNMIPVFTATNNFIEICIDTSDGIRYSDFNYNGRENTFRRINSNLNWRYYARFFYDYDEPDLNNIKVGARLSKVEYKDYYNVTTWLNLTNGTKNSITIQLKSNLTRTTSASTISTASSPTTTCASSTQTESTDHFSTINIKTTYKEITTYNPTTTQNEIITTTKSVDEIVSNIFSPSNEMSNMSVSELITLLENKTFKLELTAESSLPVDLLKSTQDITNCVTNCSNQGLCKLKDLKFGCECNLDFTGAKCETDLRPCSNNPCLNFIKCENIKNGFLQYNQEFQSYQNYYTDFKCICKNNYYGKRCESKINLCQNETCSGNGVCKTIENSLTNETIKCECFGTNQYEGNKCEIKSSKMQSREATIKFTYVIAIIVMISLYLLIILSDLHNLLTSKTKIGKKKKTSKKQ